MTNQSDEHSVQPPQNIWTIIILRPDREGGRQRTHCGFSNEVMVVVWVVVWVGVGGWFSPGYGEPSHHDRGTLLIKTGGYVVEVSGSIHPPTKQQQMRQTIRAERTTTSVVCHVHVHALL